MPRNVVFRTLHLILVWYLIPRPSDPPLTCNGNQRERYRLEQAQAIDSSET